MNLLRKPYCLVIIALVLIGCSLQLAGDEVEDIPLISHAEELYVHNDLSNYFIQLEPSGAKIGQTTIFYLMKSGKQRTENNDKEILIVSAYIH